MAALAFRVATTEDVDALVSLINRAYRPDSEHAGWTHEADIVSGNRVNAEQVIQVTHKDHSALLVAVINHQLCACVQVEKLDTMSSSIGMLAVDPIFQGTGTGKAVLKYAEQYAITTFHSQRFIMYVVSLRRELIEFYLRRGYQRTGEIMDYPTDAQVGIPKFNEMTIEVLEKVIRVESYS